MEPFMPHGHAKFCVAHAALHQVMAPAWLRYQHTGDAQQMGLDYAGSMEACSKSCLQLSLQEKPVEQQQSIMAELYCRYSKSLVAEPHKSLGDCIVIDLVRHRHAPDHV